MPVGIGRLPVVTGVVCVALLLPAQGALADPQPTMAQARAKLAKLNERADKVVDQYNAARERYRAAKKKYDRLNKDLNRQARTVEDLRRELVSMARSAYQTGGLMSWPSLLSQNDPAATLGGLASMTQLAAERAQALNAFERATRSLRDQRDRAKTAYQEAEDTLEDLRAEKKKVEKLVAEQTRLLQRLGTYNRGNPNSKGVKYTGNASGDARAVLQFAYAQIGKPYRFGGEGPDGWDCSGLTQASWRAGGVELPRTTYQQWAWGAQRRVSLDDLQPGDLIFSNGISHVGIYAGDGKMVHAPQTGDVVKVVSLDSYGRGRLVGAVRP